MSLYGPIITGVDVTNAVTSTLQLWMPSYLGEVAAQAGLDRCSLPKPRSYVAADELDGWAEDQVPGVVVVVPDTADTPIRHGDGKYTVPWLAGVGVVVSGRDRATTYRLVRWYAAAARSVLLQHPSLASFDAAGRPVPFASEMQWVGERYNELDFNDSRTLAMGFVSMQVGVDAAIDSKGGFSKPPDDPCADPGEYGIVETTPLSTEAKQS